MKGRRVATLDDIERAGDYCTSWMDDGGTRKRSLWFLLPIHEGDKFNHAPGCGLRVITEPPWTFRECADGSVEVRASIYCTPGEPGEWHGYLDEGHEWRTC